MGTLSFDAAKGGFDKSFAYERRVFKYTGPSSYATGGDSLTPESVRLGMIAAILGLAIWNGTAVLWGVWDATNKKVLWYSATGTQVSNLTDLSAYVGYFEVIGK